MSAALDQVDVIKACCPADGAISRGQREKLAGVEEPIQDRVSHGFEQLNLPAPVAHAALKSSDRRDDTHSRCAMLVSERGVRRQRLVFATSGQGFGA